MSSLVHAKCTSSASGVEAERGEPVPEVVLDGLDVVPGHGLVRRERRDVVRAEVRHGRPERRALRLRERPRAGHAGVREGDQPLDLDVDASAVEARLREVGRERRGRGAVAPVERGERLVGQVGHRASFTGPHCPWDGGPDLPGPRRAPPQPGSGLQEPVGHAPGAVLPDDPVVLPSDPAAVPGDADALELALLEQLVHALPLPSRRLPGWESLTAREYEAAVGELEQLLGSVAAALAAARTAR